MRASPEHVTAYFEVAALWEDIPRLVATENVDIEALVASAIPEADTAWRDARPVQQQRARTIFRPVAWAVALVACIGLGIAGWLLLPRPQTYATQVGEQRSIALNDGSTVELDTRSRIRVRLERDARKIELLEGQALFHVAKDERRPFIVSCDEVRVRAVGTQFDVYRKASGMKLVTVIEGHVAVLPGTGRNEVLLGPGDQVTVTAESVTRTEPTDVDQATAWKQRSVVFHGTPLGEVVAELNRYNRKQIIVDDPSMQAVRINGVFSSTNPASLLRFLREQLGASVNETDTAIHIARNKTE
jgi:transmembrane sensor